MQTCLPARSPVLTHAHPFQAGEVESSAGFPKAVLAGAGKAVAAARARAEKAERAARARAEKADRAARARAEKAAKAVEAARARAAKAAEKADAARARHAARAEAEAARAALAGRAEESGRASSGVRLAQLLGAADRAEEAAGGLRRPAEGAAEGAAGGRRALLSVLPPPAADGGRPAASCTGAVVPMGPARHQSSGVYGAKRSEYYVLESPDLSTSPSPHPSISLYTGRLKCATSPPIATTCGFTIGRGRGKGGAVAGGTGSREAGNESPRRRSDTLAGRGLWGCQLPQAQRPAPVGLGLAGRARARACMCVRACVRVCVRACVRVCVCVRAREHPRARVNMHAFV